MRCIYASIANGKKNEEGKWTLLFEGKLFSVFTPCESLNPLSLRGTPNTSAVKLHTGFRYLRLQVPDEKVCTNLARSLRKKWIQLVNWIICGHMWTSSKITSWDLRVISCHWSYLLCDPLRNSKKDVLCASYLLTWFLADLNSVSIKTSSSSRLFFNFQ